MTIRLKLGTRRSLLAMAQSKLVAQALQLQHPDIEIEVVGIETRGDRILDVPLSQMEGKDFFVAELDKALLSGAIDFSVHSMKDLSLERPEGISVAALPARENPRDIVLFAPDILDRLRAGGEIRLGTSSPRRMENVPPFLARALPQLGVTPNIVTHEIRGNVHTRIKRLHTNRTDPENVQAVVLAFAGLIRLWQDPEGQEALRPLLHGLRWMVLPLKDCPAAPAQGALAIECRSEDKAAKALLGTLHNVATEAAVRQERKVLAQWGGGCHQRLGATAEPHEYFGSLMHIRGRNPDGILVAETRWENSVAAIHGDQWDGTHWREASFTARYYADLPPPAWLREHGALLIAHSRALPSGWHSALTDGQQRVWTSGVRSWFRLAAAGIWVEGCAEELGFDTLRETLRQGVLQLPRPEHWHVLTHEDGADTWTDQQVIATYTVEAATGLDENHPAVRALQRADSAFWSSGSQFELFRNWIPADCNHACRFGKTYNYLRQQLDQNLTNNVQVSEQQLKNGSNDRLTAYPSAADWRNQALKSHD
jgi:hydroxymethylbilane synthase